MTTEISPDRFVPWWREGSQPRAGEIRLIKVWNKEVHCKLCVCELISSGETLLFFYYDLVNKKVYKNVMLIDVGQKLDEMEMLALLM